MPLINFYQRFMNGPEVKPLTPKEKARLAARNVLDPFNAVTILGNAAITIGYNSHSVYGPGMHGFAQLVGVSYSEDMTGEFFGTFLIPSIVHQDPHYHRMPHATIKRRILHAIVQVGWTQGDNGKGMPNYANILGFPIDAEIANLYVPGERDQSALDGQPASPSAGRWPPPTTSSPNSCPTSPGASTSASSWCSRSSTRSPARSQRAVPRRGIKLCKPLQTQAFDGSPGSG